MTTHTNCTHPATKAARAACRRDKASADIAGAAVARAKAAGFVPAPAHKLIVKIAWERETCSRCGGTGRYPSAMWQGMCLKCEGGGQMLTRAGRAALAKYNAYLELHHSVRMIDLQPGDVTRTARGERRTVVNVDPTIQRGGTCTIGVKGSPTEVSFCSLTITVHFQKVTQIVGPYVTTIVPPKGEAMQAALRHVEKMKGALVTYAD